MKRTRKLLSLLLALALTLSLLPVTAQAKRRHDEIDSISVSRDIDFYDWDGTFLGTGTIKREAQSRIWTVSGVPKNLTRQGTETYEWLHDGWADFYNNIRDDHDHAKIQDSYTAHYDKAYRITFYASDGITEIKTKLVKEGDTPDCTVTKASSAQYDYIFTGWSPKPVPASAHAGYTATWNETTRQYNVSFVDEDGTWLYEAEYDYGTPAASITKPADPAKEATATHFYTFAGWTPELSEVTGDAVYTASYTETARSYTITFKDDAGAVLDAVEVPWGDTPSYTPSGSRTLVEWRPTPVPVTGDATYAGVFTDTQFTVEFRNWDGELLHSASVTYSGTPAYAGTPVRSASGDYTYTFAGWTDGARVWGVGKSLPLVTDDTVYTAVYTCTENYTVTLSDGMNGTPLTVSLPVTDDYTVPENPFDVPAGKRFLCWTDGENDFIPGAVLTDHRAVTLTAVWVDLCTVTVTGWGAEKVRYSWTYSAHGVALTGSSEPFPEGAVLSFSGLPTSGDYTVTPALGEGNTAETDVTVALPELRQVTWAAAPAVSGAEWYIFAGGNRERQLAYGVPFGAIRGEPVWLSLDNKGDYEFDISVGSGGVSVTVDPPSIDNGGFYTFTMPDADAVITVTAAIPSMTAGVPMDFPVGWYDRTVTRLFTPSESCTYRISSAYTGDYDGTITGGLFEADGDLIQWGTTGDLDNGNFLLDAYLEAGTTYQIRVKGGSDTVPVTVEQQGYIVSPQRGCTAPLWRDKDYYQAGETVTLEADDGYSYSNVKILYDDTEQELMASSEVDETYGYTYTVYTFTMPAANVVFSAAATEKPYAVNYEIYVYESEECVGMLYADRDRADAGDTITVLPVPNDTYQVQSLTYTPEDGTEAVSLTQNANGTFEFTMPASDVTLTAVYERGEVTLELVSYDRTLNEPPVPNTVTVGSNQSSVWKFTPQKSGIYVFYSTGDNDTYATLYDSEWNELERSADGGEGSNFRIWRYLAEGETYYLSARFFDGSSGSFPVFVMFEKEAYGINSVTVTGGEATVTGYDGSGNAYAAPGAEYTIWVSCSDYARPTSIKVKNMYGEEIGWHLSDYSVRLDENDPGMPQGGVTVEVTLAYSIELIYKSSDYTVSAAGTGVVSSGGDYTASSGAEVTVTSTPKAGKEQHGLTVYQIVETENGPDEYVPLDVTAAGENQYTFVMPQSGVNVIANSPVSITFDANGGTGGTMADTSGYYATFWTLPACAFTAPVGQTFAGWYSDFDKTYAPGDSVQVPLSTLHLKAMWTELTDPVFSKHNLLLSSEIGVQFKLTFPEGFDTTGSYMSFSVSDGRTSRMDISAATAVDGENAWWFSCYVNALELADTITATYHYGSGQTVTSSYSATTYITAAKTVYPDNEKLIAIVNALQDYGHYLQQSGWTDGKEHTAIPAITVLDADSITTARSDVSSLQVVKSLEGTGIADAKFALTLNTKTVINVFVKPEDGVTITSATGTAKGTRIIGGETYYQYDTAEISAGDLSKSYTISVTTGSGTATVTASAMSYVYEVLKEGSTFTQAKQYAMAAYYNYYAAAWAYQH